MRGLAKRYGEIEAVRGIDFEVAPGEIFGFLGPNGAGKSTTISMLCTLVKPTGGSATVAGFDVDTQRDAVRRNIGLVFQDTTLDDYLTAEENLKFHAELYGVRRELVDARLRKVMEMVGLWERRKSLVRTFSGGMARRLEIAQSTLHRPAVLFMDEPTVGLDPDGRRAVWEHVHALRQEIGAAVVFSTHYMDEAEDVSDRLGVVAGGRLKAVGSPAELKAQVGDGASLDDVFTQLTGLSLNAGAKVQ